MELPDVIERMLAISSHTIVFFFFFFFLKSKVKKKSENEIYLQLKGMTENGVL